MVAPLGPYVDFSGTCERAIGPSWDNLCPKVAAWHIIWTDDAENSMACEEHAMESVMLFGAIQMHDRTLDCGMPGCLWVRDEHRCIREEVPTLEAQLTYATDSTAR